VKKRGWGRTPLSTKGKGGVLEPAGKNEETCKLGDGRRNVTRQKWTNEGKRGWMVPVIILKLPGEKKRKGHGSAC